jgi:hypothetical protein
MTATPPDRPSAASFATQHRALVGSLISGLVVIALALAFVLPTGETPPGWVALGLIAAGVVDHLVLDAVGYRLPPLDPSLDDDAAAAEARVRYQTSTILRFAMSEVIAIVSVALAFVLPEGGFSTFAVGAGVSVSLMGVHVWPSARPIGRAADSLEAAGQRSGLRETFGLPG